VTFLKYFETHYVKCMYFRNNLQFSVKQNNVPHNFVVVTLSSCCLVLNTLTFVNFEDEVEQFVPCFYCLAHHERALLERKQWPSSFIFTVLFFHPLQFLNTPLLLFASLCSFNFPVPSFPSVPLQCTPNAMEATVSS
jgi:hypothetical protein